MCVLLLSWSVFYTLANQFIWAEINNITTYSAMNSLWDVVCSAKAVQAKSLEQFKKKNQSHLLEDTD